MKAIIFILILTSFLQSTIFTLDLVLIILITRTFITKEKGNLYLAFFIGLLVSLLSATPLGLQSLIYILTVGIITIVARIRIMHTALIFIPSIIILLSLNQVLIALSANQSIILWPKIGWDLLAVIPVYILLRLWEERFVVKPDVKLKV